MGEVRFEYTVDDYLAANRLNSRLVYFSRKGLRALVIVWICYFIISMTFISEWTAGDAATLAGGTALGTVVIAAALIGVNALMLPRRSKRLFLQQRSLEGHLEARWNSEQIEFLSPTGVGRHPWHHFVKAAENDRVMMLYQSDIMYNMIPKRALDAASLAEIRQALSANDIPLFIK